MRSPRVYNSIVEEIIQIYLDYDIKSFPLDLDNICRKMGVALIPYSECGHEANQLLLKRTKKGFFVRGSQGNPPTIYYNDSSEISIGEMRFTIAHEIKHYVYNESSDDETIDDLADYFARFFLCPIPYLIVMNLTEPNAIVSHCNVSLTAAINASSTIRNRKASYKSTIFDYEEPLLEHLVPSEYFVYKFMNYDNDSGRWL